MRRRIASVFLVGTCVSGLALVWPAAAQVGTSGSSFASGQIHASSQLPDILPFDFWQGLIVVKAYLGDGLPDQAVLDTGLSLCLGMPDFIAKRGGQMGNTRDVEILDRPVRVLDAKTQKLRVDHLVLTDVPFGAFNLYGYLSAKPAPGASVPPLWLGNSALAALTITIDPREQKLIFRAAGGALPLGATIVPFELKAGRIWVEARANGKKDFSALLDTGSVGTLLPAGTARDLKLTPKATFPLTHPNGKEGKVGAVQLDEVSLGDLKVRDVQALYISEPVKDGFDPDLGIIGNDVLMRYRVTIDYGRKKLAFEKLPPLKTDSKKDDPKKTGKPSRKDKDKDATSGAAAPSPSPPGPAPTQAPGSGGTSGPPTDK